MLQRILRFSIEHPGFILLLTLVSVAAGAISLLRLPIDAVPDITNNQVQINTLATSLSPMEVEKQVCNAGSILELMVAVGSHPDARRFVFRGDEHPLRDIGLLFQYGLGEHGIDRLPDDLDYLRNK